MRRFVCFVWPYGVFCVVFTFVVFTMYATCMSLECTKIDSVETCDRNKPTWCVGSAGHSRIERRYGDIGDVNYYFCVCQIGGP